MEPADSMELFSLPFDLSKRIVEKFDFSTISNLEETSQIAHNFVVENVKETWLEVKKANLFNRKIYFYDKNEKLVYVFPGLITNKKQESGETKKRSLVRNISLKKRPKFYIKIITVQERLEWHIYTLLNFLWGNNLHFEKLILEDHCEAKLGQLAMLLEWPESLSMSSFANREYCAIGHLRRMKYLKMPNVSDDLFLGMKCVQFEGERLWISIESWLKFFEQWKRDEREVERYSVSGYQSVAKQLIDWLKINGKFNGITNLRIDEGGRRLKKQEKRWYLERESDQQKLFVAILLEKIHIYSE